MAKLGAPNIARFGETALVLDVGGPLSLDVQRALGRAATMLASVRGAEDVVAGIGNLTLFFDPTQLALSQANMHLVDAWRRAQSDNDAGAQVTVEIPVRYGGVDGPDLEVVADACGIDAEACVARHLAGTYAVYVMGFAPGFAYIGGLDASLHTSRRAQPRTRVPAGSVAIAGDMTGIYPRESPGGWNIIGRTDMTLFDPHQTPAARLEVGMRVRFIRR